MTAEKATGNIGRETDIIIQLEATDNLWWGIASRIRPEASARIQRVANERATQ